MGLKTPFKGIRYELPDVGWNRIKSQIITFYQYMHKLLESGFLCCWS